AQRIAATNHAFAAILGDGTALAWGSARAFAKRPRDEGFGGDCSLVQQRLKGVKHIQATQAAFAALLADGSVVAWGSPEAGGDSSSVQHDLKKVTHIQATKTAFAAIRQDGS
ncbi:HERC2, partial [Symbiodinium pilosum]